jgi:DNA mismatch repair ATPase MutS
VILYNQQRKTINERKAKRLLEVENMKNEIIILDAKQKLAEQGLIKYTGRTLMIELMDGSEYTFKETEQIHTFMEWKRLGYKVKKGSKAITKLQIWVPTVKENEDGIKTTKFWLKNSAFFSESQVEKIKEKGGEK